MKRFSLIIAISMFLLVPVCLWAAGSSCVITYSNTVPVEKIVFTCTGDDAAGTFPNTTTKALHGWILAVETNPGSTGPTDNYDIVYNTSTGVDVMGGNTMNRDVANTERAVPAVSGWVDGTITQVVTNASVNSATFTSTIWFWRQE